MFKDYNCVDVTKQCYPFLINRLSKLLTNKSDLGQGHSSPLSSKINALCTNLFTSINKKVPSFVLVFGLDVEVQSIR